MNSTHVSILAIAAITIASMAFGVDFAEYATTITLLGAYAGIREYKRVKDNNKESIEWSGNKTESLETIVN